MFLLDLPASTGSEQLKHFNMRIVRKGHVPSGQNFERYISLSISQ